MLESFGVDLDFFLIITVDASAIFGEFSTWDVLKICRK